MSLTIVRERPSRRRAYGINAPLFVSVAGGGRVRAREWSHLGLVLTKDALPPLDGGLVHVVLHLNFQGYDIAVPAKAREDLTGDSPTPEGCVRLEFVDLPQRSAALIEHFVEDYVRGRIVPAEDTLVRIDAPPEPISTKPDPPKLGAPEPRRSLRPLLTTLFYLVLGLGVMGYIGLLLYANMVRLEVQTAVVTRPIEVIQMPTDAVLSEVLSAPGDTVEPGGVIARIADPDLIARREEAGAARERAEREVDLVRRRIAVEAARLRDYRLVNATERREASARIEGHREELAALETRMKAVAALAARGFATRASLDEIEARTALARARLREAELEERRLERMEQVSRRRHHNGREFIVDLDMLELELGQAIAERDRLEAGVRALARLDETRDVRTGPGGRVVEIPAVAGQQLVRLTPIAVIERDEPAVVEAYLNQEEVQELGLGDLASVYLPATELRFDARIVEIDRTTGFVDEQRAQYTWRGPQDRSARIVMRIEDAALADELDSGLPATVLFRRREASSIGASLVEEARALWQRVVHDADGTRTGTGRGRTGGGAAPDGPAR